MLSIYIYIYAYIYIYEKNVYTHIYIYVCVYMQSDSMGLGNFSPPTHPTGPLKHLCRLRIPLIQGSSPLAPGCPDPRHGLATTIEIKGSERRHRHALGSKASHAALDTLR